ncbi:MAG: PAS domain S-box protein [Bacteroidales bacterium]|nr:PAS domain S-box protein [Bacteroidales bacterium]
MLRKPDEYNKLLEENKKLKNDLEKFRQQSGLTPNDFLIYDASPTGILLAGDKFIIEYANKALGDIVGLPAKEMIGKDFRIWVVEENQELVSDRYLQRRKGMAIPKTYELKVNSASGEQKNVELSTAILKGSFGLKTIAQITDITEKKRVEKSVLDSQQFLSNLFESIQDGISVLDKDMKVIMTNRWMEKMYADEMPLVGKKCYEVYHRRSELCSVCPTIQTINDGKPHTEIVSYVKGGKQEGWIELSSYPVMTEKDKISSIIEYVKDITEHENATQELKKTTDKLSNIMRAANDGMWDWNLVTGDVEFDPRYYEMAGYSVNEFAHRLEEFQERIHPEDREYVMKEAQEHLEGKTKRFRVEFRFRRKDKAYMWILGRGIIVDKDNDGKPTRLMGTHTDISELKKIMNDLRKAKEKAEESDRLKSAFLANMSHEIRTPMNGIMGFSELLTEGNTTPEESAEYLKVIKQSGKRMLDTLNDIIDLSKLEAGQMDISLSENNINDHFDYLYKFFHPEIQHKDIEFQIIKEHPQEEVIIKTDHEKLLAILSNLMKNAIKYTRRGKIEMGYTLHKGEIEFYVNDTGIGISKDRQNVIFDRFVQADLTITKKYEGAGLGLSISKGFIELMGGKIWVKSASGKGSDFHFTIPLNRKTEEQKSSISKRNQFPNMSKIRKLNILIAEDDDSAMFYLKEILKSHCKKIFMAGSGIEAVKIIEENTEVDLILMDIKMPDMDGFEAARKIRKMRPDIKIIGQTAYAMIGDKEKVLSSGCDDYITKPINKNNLIKVINKHF